MNDYRLPEAVSTPVRKDVAVNRDASYRNAELFIILAGRVPGIVAIHFQRFHERDTEGVQQFVSGTLLAIDARNLLDPTDPPWAILLHNRCISLIHPSF